MYKCNIDIVCYIAVAGNKAYLFQKQIHFPSPLRHRKCTRVWIWFPHLSWIHQMDGGHCCKLGVVGGVGDVVVVAVVDIVVQVWLSSHPVLVCSHTKYKFLHKVVRILKKRAPRDVTLQQGVVNIWIFARFWNCWENPSKRIRAADKNKEKVEK